MEPKLSDATSLIRKAATGAHHNGLGTHAPPFPLQKRQCHTHRKGLGTFAPQLAVQRSTFIRRTCHKNAYATTLQRKVVAARTPKGLGPTRHLRYAAIGAASEPKPPNATSFIRKVATGAHHNDLGTYAFATQGCCCTHPKGSGATQRLPYAQRLSCRIRFQWITQVARFRKLQNLQNV